MTNNLDWSNTAIYDEIYGYIPLTNIELRIVNHPLFQRLNYIRQLGNTYRVFPGAQHTRFSHSLGVMHIIDKMITSKYIEDTIEDRQLLRLAALLHDIGHYPFSHAIETVYMGKSKEGKHEKFGAHVLSKYSIKDELENYKPEEISKIFLGTSDNSIYNQLMVSDLDSDRIDYLLRDSIHTGVIYGRFDLDRIIYMLRISKNELLGVHKNGIQAVDGYVIGRHLMWTTVYTHKTTAGYDELLKAAFKNTIDKEYESLDRLKSLDENMLIKFTDNYVLNNIASNIKSENKYVSELCNMYINRNNKNHLHIAEKYEEFTIDGKFSSKYHNLNTYKNEKNLERLMTEPYLKGWIFHSDSNTKFPNLNPNIVENYYRVKISPEKKGSGEMIKSIYIIDDDKNEVIYQDYENSLTKHLTNLSYAAVRIFTKEEYREEVKKIIAKDIKENVEE